MPTPGARLGGLLLSWALCVVLVPVASAQVHVDAGPSDGASTIASLSELPSEITLADAYAILERDGIYLPYVESRARVAESERIGAQARPDPSFEFEVFGAMAGNDLVDGSQHMVSFVLPVLLRDKRGARSRAVDLRIAAIQTEGRAELYEARVEVREAFVDAQVAIARVGELETLIDELDRLIAIVDRQIQAGVVSPYDQERLIFEREQFRAEVRSARRDALEAGARLGEAVGAPGWTPMPSEPLRTDPRIDLPSLDTVLTPERLPALAALEAAALEAEQSLRVAQIERTPELDLGFGLLVGTHDPGLAGMLSFGIDLPVRDGNRGEIALAEAELAAIDTERELTRRALQTEFMALQRRIDAALDDLDMFDETVFERLPQLRRMVEIAYVDGAMGIAELVDLVEQEAEARIERLEILAEIFSLQARYLALAGE